MTTQRSRPKRWSAACEAVRIALEDLHEMQFEYQEWHDNMPENMESTPTAEKLDAVIELDIEEMMSTIEEADGLDLPRGFGRD